MFFKGFEKRADGVADAITNFNKQRKAIGTMSAPRQPLQKIEPLRNASPMGANKSVGFAPKPVATPSLAAK